MVENILVTTDYDKFKLCSWNRAINQRNLQRLDKSVQKDGWKKHPIVVNDNMEVIDGQHRLIYAKSHALPVYYIVIDGLTVEDCVVMNNARAGWSPLDFIKLYAEQGNENYMRLKELVDNYTFAPVSQIVALIKCQSGNGNLSYTLNRGEYTLTEQEMVDVKAKLDYLQELSSVVKKVRGRLASIYKVLGFCYSNEKVDNERLKAQIESRISTMQPPANIEMAVEEIDKMYNHRIGQSNYVDIVAEYKKWAREQMLTGTKANAKMHAQRRDE